MGHFSVFIPCDQYLLSLKKESKENDVSTRKTHKPQQKKNTTAAAPNEAVNQLWFNLFSLVAP